VSARTDFNVIARAGTTIFMVPSDTPGFRIGKVFNKSGWRFYQNAELIFENARVPHANVVGEVNGGARIRSGSAAEFGDLELAANALGVCEAACESALNLARTRTQGGKPLLEQQTVQLSIGRMRMLTEALRSYVLRAAWEMDQGFHGSVNAVLVMNFSTAAIQEVTERNMAIHGASGYTMNTEAAKLVRDGIIWTHLAGDATQRLKVIRRFPKDPVQGY
jgi:alkylation response protein AidB-like acyl-CoA dehydrogenase